MEDGGRTACGYHPQWMPGGDPCWRDAHRDRAPEAGIGGHRPCFPAHLVVQRAWHTQFANGWLPGAFEGPGPDTDTQYRAYGCSRVGTDSYCRKTRALFPVRYASVQTLNVNPHPCGQIAAHRVSSPPESLPRFLSQSETRP